MNAANQSASARSQRAGRREQEQAASQGVPAPEQPQAADYLFVLTADFNCALMFCSKETGKIQVVSKGNISDKIGERRE